MAVDLHIHSTASDGTLSPSKIMSEAARLDLSAASITDHDTLAGIDEAAAAAEKLGIDFIPGVELSAYYKGQDVHILGYFLDQNNGPLNDKLVRLRESRELRAKNIIEKLHSIGIGLDWASVERLARGEAVGRPHIAQALINEGFISDIPEAFAKFLGSDCPAYVPKYVLDLEDIFETIHDAGGITSLAHPAHFDVDETVIAKLKNRGLDAIEAWHTDHSDSDVRRFIAMADKFDLLLTGGSDCHGSQKRRGFVMGSLEIPDSLIAPLRQRADEIRRSV